MLIFGNGPGQDQDVEAQPTRSIFGDLFGIGPLIKMLTDPAMMAGAQAMMGAITAGGEAAQRLEAKLDLLLKAQGHDVEALNREFADNAQSTVMLKQAIAALPPGGSGFGVGPTPLASPPLDDGNGADAGGNRPAKRSHHKRGTS